MFSFLNIVTGLNVNEFNQMYEIRGRPLSKPNACERHETSYPASRASISSLTSLLDIVFLSVRFA